MFKRENIVIILVVTMSVFCLAALVSCNNDLEEPGKKRDSDRLEVLFLGEEEPLRATDPLHSIVPYFTRENIYLFYSDGLASLNDRKLTGYDVVMINSKLDGVTITVEKALLRFVEEGGGLVLLNAATESFQTSAFSDLAGGDLAGYGSGIRDIHVEINNPDHPIMQGISGIESEDEAITHQSLSEDKTILSYRIEDGHKEPWTWVRKQGRGRVFYTSWGSTAATWSNTNFRKLLEQGIKWTAGDRGLKLEPRSMPFEYTKVVYPSLLYDTPLEEEKQPRPMQRPLTAEQSQERMVARPGFKVELFASEPDIRRPLAMSWDQEGRLWITESKDYPNNLNESPGEGSDQIKILEDTDGDHKADKFTVFAKNLSIPSSLTFANGGVITQSPPYTIFLKDTTGDDKADVRKILFKGWNTFDTHAGPSNLHRGFDNWIWGTVGYSGFEGSVGRKDHEFSMGVYRFRPDGSELEFVRSTNNNTWGLGFSEEGYVFGSTANRNPVFYMPIPNRYYETVKGFSPQQLGTIANSAGIHPITNRTYQGDNKGFYTSGSGFSLYTARQFPKEYWNRSAFVGDPTVNLLGQFQLKQKGSDFIALNQWNMVASDDEWFAPIQTQVGPDGALWMIDWYNYIPTHNLGPFSEGWEHGKGNAFISDLRDKERGRIYRIVYEDASDNKSINLQEANPQQLIKALQNDNLFWRKTAQRLLVERGKTDITEDLYALIRDQSTDQLGLNVGAIHALWTLKGLGALDNTGTKTETVVKEALLHPSRAVRRTAVKLLPKSEVNRDTILRENLLYDSSAQVRLAALLKLSELPKSEDAGRTIYRMMKQQQNFNDRWIPDAAAIAGAHHAPGFLKAAVTDIKPPLTLSETLPESNREVIKKVSAHYVSDGPADSISSILAEMKEANPQIGDIILKNMENNWPEGSAPDLTGNQEKTFGQLSASIDQDEYPRIKKLFRRWSNIGPAEEATEEPGGNDEVSVERGKTIALENGCQSCHSTDGSKLVGPSWHNLYGYKKTLDSGETVVADEAYLQESITEPSVKVVKGYPANMVSYSYLSESKVNSLIAYIKSLSDKAE